VAAPPEYTDLVAREDERLDALDVAALSAIAAAYAAEQADLYRSLQAQAKRLPASAQGKVTTGYAARVIREHERTLTALAKRLDTALTKQQGVYTDRALRDVYAELTIGVTPDYRRRLQALQARIYKLQLEPKHADPLERAMRYALGQGEDLARIALARGRDAAWLADAVADDAESIYTVSRSRLGVVLRTEAAATYSEAHQAALVYARDTLNDRTIQRRAYELRDKRNHPLSRLLDGRVVAVDEPWRVAVADVAKMANTMKKSPGGVIWPVKGASYEGSEYPAHYNERGRQTLWRSTWG
jgi:hypothetical protein